jgi:hypothetical protein
VKKHFVDFTYRSLNNGVEGFEAHEIIPILRPLTDISNQECLELALADGYDEEIIKTRPEAVITNIRQVFNWKRKDLMLSMKMTAWLARHGFDIWGWIDDRVALDKTKQILPELVYK